MHVLILPSWYFEAGDTDIGGRNFHLLTKALREKKIDARILYAYLSHSGPIFKARSYQIEDDVPTWRVKRWFAPKIFPLLVRLWILAYVKEIMEYIRTEGRPDIIHAQSYMTSLVAHVLRKKTNIPFIYTEHLSRFIDNRIPAQHKNLISESCKAAGLITCVSPGLKSKLQAYTSNHIEVVPNFYDPAVFHPGRPLKKNRIFTWVSIGEPSFTKGLDLLIAAFGQVKQQLPLSEMQVILIDHIKDKEALIKLAIDNKVDKWIKWTDLIPHEEIADILRSSHVLISSSRVETFGTVMAEAQACGLPVIASKTDGANFILTSPEQGILVELNDVNSLANAMTDVHLNYAKYLPETIIDCVASRFKKDIVIDQWINLYNKVVT